AQLEVLGHVVDDLRPVVGGRRGPGRALDGGLHRVTDVLAVAEGSLTDALALRPQHRVAVVAVRSLLLAADVELGGAVDGRAAGGGAPAVLRVAQQLGSGGLSQVVHGVLPEARLEGGPEVLEHALVPALAAEAALPVAAEAGGGVELVGRVDPHHAGLELRCDVEGEVDVLGPDAGGEAVARVVGQLDGLLRRAEGEADDDRPEDLLLSYGRGWRDVGEQGRRVVPALLRNGPAGLEAVGAVGLALLDQALDLAQLHGRDDRADVDALVQRGALAQRLHALPELRLDLGGDALLHQQAAAGAADLTLVEPDGVDDALHRAVE